MVDSAYYSTQTWDRQVRDSLKDRLIWSQIHNYVVKLVIWGME
jgi:hypothetical protein